MSDGFDTQIQSDEIIPEEYEDWLRVCAEVYETSEDWLRFCAEAYENAEI